MAREFEAFMRVKKINNPIQLLKGLFLYCRLDKSFKEVAGNFTLTTGQKISDTAIMNRLQKKVLRHQMYGYMEKCPCFI